MNHTSKTPVQVMNTWPKCTCNEWIFLHRAFSFEEFFKSSEFLKFDFKPNKVYILQETCFSSSDQKYIVHFPANHTLSGLLSLTSLSTTNRFVLISKDCSMTRELQFVKTNCNLFWSLSFSIERPIWGESRSVLFGSVIWFC